MKRIILAALVGVLVSGPVWGQEQEYVCSNMKGVSLTQKDGNPKFFEDAFTGTEFIVSIRNDSVTVTWRGVMPLIDKATVVKGSDDGDDVSFFSNWPSVVRLYTLNKTRKNIFLTMTEHQITGQKEPHESIFKLRLGPRARSFIATCR